MFSWKTSDDNCRIVIDVDRPVYVLIPESYQRYHGRKCYREDCYAGNGIFGEKDAFALLAIWNQKVIPTDFESQLSGWFAGKSLKRYLKMEDISSFTEEELHDIGIWLICAKDGGPEIPYPLKIVSDPGITYEEALKSEPDILQG